MSTDAVERTLEQTITQSMWVGDLAALNSLIRECQELEALSHADIRAEFAMTIDSRRADYLRQNYIDPRLSAEEIEDRWINADQEQIATNLARVALKLTVKSKNYAEELEGPPALVLAEISRPDEVQRAQITMGSKHGYYDIPKHSGLSLVLSKSGVDAVIFSGNKYWVDTAKNRIENELRRQRPWYFWLGGSLGSALAVNLPLWLSSSFLSIALFRNVDTDWWILVAIWVPAIAIAIVLGWHWTKLVPLFEMYPDGKSSRGSRILYYLGAALLWVLGSLIVPVALG